MSTPNNQQLALFELDLPAVNPAKLAPQSLTPLAEPV